MKLVVAIAVALAGLVAGCGGQEEPERPAPVAHAGDDQTVNHRGLITLSGKGTSWNAGPVSFIWKLVTKPSNSVARLSNPAEQEPTFVADVKGIYQLALVVSDGSKSSDPDIVTVEYAAGIAKSDGEKRYAWEDLQQQIDAQGDGATINLDPNVTYVLDSALDLRGYSNVRINGNGAVIMRADASEISTKLAALYLGTDVIEVTHVPSNYRPGDVLMIAPGISDGELTLTPRKIVSIDGTRITVDAPFHEIFKAGITVFKSYRLITGRASEIPGGSNPGTIIENITFDDNARGNDVNYSWRANGTILLHGGKTSEIRFNRFIDITNENIVGHGVDIHHNTFDGLNGSAFHTSVHDMTKDLNGRSYFRKNAVFDPNRIPRGLNRHSEGAITFSWGAGNLDVTDNLFVSFSGNFGVLGYFNGEFQNTDENLRVMRNQAYNFQYVIEIHSPDESPVRNVLIAENVFENCGTVLSWNLSGNETVRIGCNTNAVGDLIDLGINNLACI